MTCDSLPLPGQQELFAAYSATEATKAAARSDYAMTGDQDQERISATGAPHCPNCPGLAEFFRQGGVGYSFDLSLPELYSDDDVIIGSDAKRTEGGLDSTMQNHGSSIPVSFLRATKSPRKEPKTFFFDKQKIPSYRSCVIRGRAIIGVIIIPASKRR